MQKAIITVPKATLYETAQGCGVADELLSGWIIKIRQSWKDRMEVTTHYGYSGWLKTSAIRPLLPEEHRLWNPIGHEPPPVQEQGCHLDANYAAMICHTIIDVLECPKVQAKVLSTLFMGSAVIPLGSPIDGWQKIQLADKRCGYVPASAILKPPLCFPDQESFRSGILGYARSYLDAPYRWGDKTREGIDCSGLTFMSYYMCGVSIYRDAAIVEGYPVHAIPLSQIQPADLLYFPSHIALYLGNGLYIHSTGNIHTFGCTINSLNPKDANFRADLAERLQGAGSIFPCGDPNLNS